MTLEKIEVRDNNNQIIMVFEEDATCNWLKKSVSKVRKNRWGRRYSFKNYINHLTLVDKKYFRRVCNGTLNIKSKSYLMIGVWGKEYGAYIDFEFSTISRNTTLYFDDCILNIEKLITLCKLCNKHNPVYNESNGEQIYFLDQFEFTKQKVICNISIDSTENFISFQLNTGE